MLKRVQSSLAALIVIASQYRINRKPHSIVAVACKRNRKTQTGNDAWEPHWRAWTRQRKKMCCCFIKKWLMVKEKNVFCYQYWIWTVTLGSNFKTWRWSSYSFCQLDAYFVCFFQWPPSGGALCFQTFQNQKLIDLCIVLNFCPGEAQKYEFLQYCTFKWICERNNGYYFALIFFRVCLSGCAKNGIIE